LKKLQYMSLIGATATMIAASAAHASSGDRADVYDTLLARNPVSAPVDAAAAAPANPATGKGSKAAARAAARAAAKADKAAGKAAANVAAKASKASKAAAKASARSNSQAATVASAPAADKPAPSPAAPAPATEPRLAKMRAPGFEGGARNRYHDLVAKHAAQNGIPFALADAVIRVESRYNPAASNGGAVGLMQIKPRTARGLGYSGATEGLHNPETNILYGVKYLAQAYRMAGGDTCGTVMRYQSGHYAKHMSGANRVYCAKIRTIYASR
jgi:soluble lytic murein transglycosylase-like protein